MKRLSAKKIGLNLTVTPEANATIRELAKASGKTLSDTVTGLAMQGFNIPVTAGKADQNLTEVNKGLRANLKDRDQRVELLDGQNADLRSDRDRAIKKGEDAIQVLEAERDHLASEAGKREHMTVGFVKPVAVQIRKDFADGVPLSHLVLGYGLEVSWVEDAIRGKF